MCENLELDLGKPNLFFLLKIIASHFFSYAGGPKSQARKQGINCTFVPEY